MSRTAESPLSSLIWASQRSAVGLLDVRNQLFEGFASVADESGVDLDVLVDFGAVDFDVNFARALGVGAQVAGDAIVEAHADGDEKIGLLEWRD